MWSLILHICLQCFPSIYLKQIHGYLVESDRLGISMEWCQLGNLDNMLKKSHSGLLLEHVARK